MGITINAYRATIGRFVNCYKNRISKFLIPRKMFFENANHNFSYGRYEWSQHYFTSKMASRFMDVRSLCGNAIAISILINILILLSHDVHPNPGPNYETHDISICHSNIRSLKAPDRLLHIKLALANQFDIITLSETWLSSGDPSDNFCINGYQKPFRRDEGKERHGGVLAWVCVDIAPFCIC